MADNKVEIKVTADTAQAVGGLAAVEKGAKGVSSSSAELGSNALGAGKGLAQVGQGADSAVAGLGKARQGVQSISEQLSVARTQIASFIATQLGLSTITSVAATADQFANLQARVKLATGEGKAFGAAFAEVSEIATRTSSSLEQTGTLFARITEAGKSAGLSTTEAVAQSLRLTETINQAVQLSGSSATASNAAVTQLIQGLQSGVLRGEEFNSVMEQAPRLSKALADGLGVTTGELRKMAEAGTLTAGTVIAALKGQADALKNEFSSLPPTVGRAIENLSTSWTLYVGETDKASGASATAASAIKLLADNLSTLGGYLLDAGQAAAGLAAVKLAQSFLGIATAAAQSGVAAAASTTAIAANTVAQQANALAVAQNSVAQQANVIATSEQAAAKARAAGSTSLLTQATYANTAGTTTNTAAQIANALAVKSVGAGADLAVAGVGRFAALLGTLKLFSLIGIVTNFKDIGTAIGEGAAKLMGYKDRTAELAAADKLAAEVAKANIELREHSQALYQAEIDKQFALSAAAKASLAEFDKLTKEGTSAADAIAKIGKDFDLAGMPGIKNATAVLDKLAADGKLTAGQFQKAWADALKGADLAVFETQARAALSGTGREAERLAQIMDASLREAIKRTGLDFDVISGGMGKASRSAINDTDAIVKGLDSLKKQGVDTGQVLTASIGKSINAADSAKAIEAVKAQIESLRKVLGDKVANGLLEDAKAKAIALGDALDKAKPGINSLREAMQALGVTSDASLKLTAKSSLEAYDFMVQKGTSSTRELSQAFARAANDAIAANNGIAPSWVQAQAGARGFELAVDAAGKTALRAMGDAANATDSAGAAAGRAAGQFDEMAVAAAKAARAASEEKYSKPKGGSVTGNTRDERLAGQVATDGSGAYALRAKQKAGTLSADDLKVAEAVMAAAEFNKQIYDDNALAYSLDGARSIFEEFNSARMILEAVKQKTRAANKDAEPARTNVANVAKVPAPAGFLPAPPRQAAAALPAGDAAATYTVKLDFGSGKTYSVNTSSDNDARVLIRALQDAQRAAGM